MGNQPLFENEPPIDNGSNNADRPPKVQNVLAQVIQRHIKKGRRIPEMMPAKPFDAAHWWIGLNPEPEHRDRPFKLDGRWQTPYIDRTRVLLCKFLAHKTPQQYFIVEGFKSGIPWKGEEIEFYREVLDQAQRMKQNPDQYIQQALKSLRELGL